MKDSPRAARRARPSEEGAALVELAIVTPLLVLLLLGIVELGWLFGQYNDVRHGAREGGRYAAVNGGVDANAGQVRDYLCASMDGLSAGMTRIDIWLDQVESNGEPGITAGDTGRVTVRAVVNSLSGAPLISPFLPDDLVSTVEFRLEQDPTWAANPPPTPLPPSPSSLTCP